MDLLRRYFKYRPVIDSHRKITTPDNVGRTRPVAPDPKPTVHKLDQRLSAAEVAQIVAEYEAGAHTTELMKTYQIGKGPIIRLLHENGATMRRQGLTDEELAQARRLYESGLSLMSVGKRMGRHHSTVHLALRRSGVEMRARDGVKRPE